MEDIAIIGGGPSGMFAVFEAGMLGLKSVIIDSIGSLGGQCRALYPQKPIYDIPACPRLLAEDLIQRLEEQIAPFKPKYILKNKVINLQEGDQHITVITDQGLTIHAKCAIIAAGCGAFIPNRLPITNSEKFEGKSIFYATPDTKKLEGKTICIAGGGDSAVDWSILLSKLAKKLYVVHRRNKFRASPQKIKIMRELEAQKKIEFLIPYQIDDVIGSDGQIKEVIVKNMNEEKFAYQCDFLLPFFGLSYDLGSISNWNIKISGKNIVVSQSTMRTNLSKVFAIGDIVTYPGKLKLISVGFAEAAIAARNIYSTIFPDQELHFQYSTSKGLPS